MKLKILIAGVAVFCVIVAPAAAVVKCVKLTQSSTCTSTTANNSSPEWTANLWWNTNQRHRYLQR